MAWKSVRVFQASFSWCRTCGVLFWLQVCYLVLTVVVMAAVQWTGEFLKRSVFHGFFKGLPVVSCDSG